MAVREHGMERVVVRLEVALQHRKRLRRERACPEEPRAGRVVGAAHLDGQADGQMDRETCKHCLSTAAKR